MQSPKPDYKRIYSDIITKKFLHKKEECETLLSKETLSVLDIIKLNQKIFGMDKESEEINQRYRSYNKSDIDKMLDYQKKNKLNNTELAKHFKLSRNTVAKWKRIFTN